MHEVPRSFFGIVLNKTILSPGRVATASKTDRQTDRSARTRSRCNLLHTDQS